MTAEDIRGPNPVGLLFRHVAETRARKLFPAGGRVLVLPDVPADASVPFDAAYAAPGALDHADLDALGRNLAAALRPGAPVLLCLARGRPPATTPGPREARARLGDAFVWTGAFGLGVIVPGERRQVWVRRHPQAFGILAALEGVVRRWPLVRSLGDHAALEGRRK